MTKNTGSGNKDAKDFAPRQDTKSGLSPAGQEIAMLIALQKREWQQLRSEIGVVLKYINLKEPTSGRNVLLVAFGSREDDVIGDDATLNVWINGIGIDAIIESVAQNKLMPLTRGEAK